MAGRKKGDGQKYIFKGELLTIPQIAEKYHLAESTVRKRFKEGYTEDNIIKKREVKKYTIYGESLTVKEIARRYNVSEQMLRYRLTHGVPEDQLFVPSGKLPPERRTMDTKEQQYNLSLSWTDSAIECYYSTNCDLCTIPDDLKPKCKMRKTIAKIVEMYGEPCGNYNFMNGKDYMTMSELREQEIAKYRERLQPYIDEVMARYDRKERRQAIYDKCMKKLKDMKG